MKAHSTFTVIPHLPDKLKKLNTIAYNMWWCWNHNAVDLLRRLDRQLWEKTNHNPVEILGKISQERLNELSNDDSYIAYLERVYEDLEDYLSMDTWFKVKYNKNSKIMIAYFSTEYGITESIPNYSGGLGVLSGDHLKSASDLGIPLVAVGLLYSKGYFRQYLNVDGWQQDFTPLNDFYNMPLKLLKNDEGEPIKIKVEYPGRDVYAQIWKLTIGRVPLYLLDANIPENSPEDREITGQLYGGDLEMRIKQEIMLGIGGYRALEKLGIYPTVFHMNEGHSAFLALERIRSLMERYNLNFEEAKIVVHSSNVFTTHTPVPAGIDIFPVHLIDKYFSSYFQRLKINRDYFLSFGRQDPFNKNEGFCMAVLALKLSAYRNGVSKLHRKTSKKLWRNVWKDISESDIPIDSITNGVHIPSWISNDMADLFTRYLGPNWRLKPGDHKIWKRVNEIPDAELWRTHERRRERLVAFARKKLKEQLKRQGASPAELKRAEEVLNPEALTIGFARRFATYKRAILIFKDLNRLKKILLNKEKPVQLIFAGKAHPKDFPGKEFIRYIVQISKQEEFRNHIVFIEDYDMNIARYLVQGCDVWLNTPRRPLEASGTSGMKAAVNGAINFSILDGWWDEAYNGENGWSIGSGEVYSDLKYQDEVESHSLYEILEKEIVPLFYKRGPDDIPREWIKIMKNSMTSIAPYFNTNRMLQEYTNLFYVPASHNYLQFSKNNFAPAKELKAWLDRIKTAWKSIKILSITSDNKKEIKVGSQITIESKIYLNNITPDDVEVQLYYGPVDVDRNFISGNISPMKLTEKLDNNVYIFKGTISFKQTGNIGFTIRILPYHPNLIDVLSLGLIIWA